MSDVQRHKRRWRSPSSWVLALLPWTWVLPVVIASHDDNWRIRTMVGLSTVYTLFIIFAWKPWGRKED